MQVVMVTEELFCGRLQQKLRFVHSFSFYFLRHNLTNRFQPLDISVPHNLTNRFQPLDISANKLSKSFLSTEYNQWFSDKAAAQLTSGKQPSDVKVSLK